MAKMTHEEQIKKSEQKIAREKEKLQRLKEQKRKRETRMKIMYSGWLIHNLMRVSHKTLARFSEDLIDKDSFDLPPEELGLWLDEIQPDQIKKIDEYIKQQDNSKKSKEEKPRPRPQQPQSKPQTPQQTQQQPQAPQAAPTVPTPPQN